MTLVPTTGSGYSTAPTVVVEAPPKPLKPLGWPWALGQPSWPVGLAAGGLLLSENLSALRRTVNPDRDRDDQVCGDDYFPVEE